MSTNDDDFEELEGPFEQTPGTNTTTGYSGSSDSAPSVELGPDDDMVGVVGDIVPSINGENGEKHFVSPKKSPEIPGDYVILKATGVSEETFPSIFEWGEGGEAVPDKPLKRRVKRDSTGKTEVTIKVKESDQVIRKINVWIVWATYDDATIGRRRDSKIVYHGSDPYLQPATNSISMTAHIEPVSIFDKTKDIPKLDGERTQDVPASDCKARWGDVSGQTIANNGAQNRWDISQSIKRVYLNPAPTTITRADYQGTEIESMYLDKAVFPAANATVSDFLEDHVEGTDDYGVVSLALNQDNDPYTNGPGEVTFDDAPQAPDVVLSSGSLGETVNIQKTFHNFVRLQIGDSNKEGYKNWYLISDFYIWNYDARFRNPGEYMTDDGSTVTTGMR